MVGRGGRPRADEPRRNVSVRLTDAERAEIAAKADAAGVSLGEWVRAAALGRRLPERDPDRRAVIVALSRIGNNLNQMTRATHRGAVSADMADALAELRAVLARL